MTLRLWFSFCTFSRYMFRSRPYFVPRSSQTFGPYMFLFLGTSSGFVWYRFSLWTVCWETFVKFLSSNLFIQWFLDVTIHNDLVDKSEALKIDLFKGYPFACSSLETSVTHVSLRLGDTCFFTCYCTCQAWISSQTPVTTRTPNTMTPSAPDITNSHIPASTNLNGPQSKLVQTILKFPTIQNTGSKTNIPHGASWRARCMFSWNYLELQ